MAFTYRHKGGRSEESRQKAFHSPARRLTRRGFATKRRGGSIAPAKNVIMFRAAGVRKVAFCFARRRRCLRRPVHLPWLRDRRIAAVRRPPHSLQ
eukprot:15474877-Alexandrium_andersonii.AAC.1